MKAKNLANLLTIPLLLALFSAPVMAQKLYRWTDKDGNVHYSDKIPPEAVEHGRTELNDQGVEVSSVERALTAEELAEEERKRREEEAAQAAIDAQRNADETILRTFTSEADIARTRDARMEAIRRNIELTESGLEAQRKRMNVLRETAADHERAGEDVPQKLVDEIQSLGVRIEDQRQFLNRRHDELAQVQEDYMHQLEAYRGARKRMGYEN